MVVTALKKEETNKNTVTHPSSPPKIIYFDSEKCTGCGLCRELCPFGLPTPDEAGKYHVLNLEACVECSACQRNCPVNAIRMTEQKGCGCLWDVRRQAANNKSGCC